MEGKEATHWTRLSCHRFRANEVRLVQQRLFKTGRRLIRHARYFIFQLAESYLTRRLFRQILQRIERLAWHGTWSGGLTHGERDKNLGHIANPDCYHMTSKEELLFSPSLTTSSE